MKGIKYIYFFLIILLLILYLFPGNFFSWIFFDELSQKTEFFSDPKKSPLRHVLAFFCLSLTGVISYKQDINLRYNIAFLFILSIFLELLHLVIPNRSFQLSDLAANLIGTALAVIIIICYKRYKNGKI